MRSGSSSSAPRGFPLAVRVTESQLKLGYIAEQGLSSQDVVLREHGRVLEHEAEVGNQKRLDFGQAGESFLSFRSVRVLWGARRMESVYVRHQGS